MPLPCGWVAGRERGIRTSAGMLRMEDLRHGLYSDAAVAWAVTGHFTVHTSEGVDQVAVQLRRGIAATEALRKATEQALFSVVDQPLTTALYGYEAYPFGKDLNYESKFRHCL